MFGQVSEVPNVGVIKNQKQFDEARAVYAAVKRLIVETTCKKNEILDPLSQSVKKIKELFKPFEDNADAVVTEYKTALNKYAQDVEADRQRKLEQVNNDKRLTNVETIQAKRNEIGQRIEGVMTHKVVEVVNPSLIPHKYWRIDLVMLRKDLLEGITVPGAIILEKPIVTI